MLLLLQKNDHGVFEFVIKVDVKVEKLQENNNPMKFARIMMYLFNPWLESFEDFGSLKNLKALMPN